MREVAWVIFDEIHYMRDKGVYVILYSRGTAHRQRRYVLVQICITSLMRCMIREDTGFFM